MSEYVLDARGLKCPLPVVNTGRKLNELKPGDVLKVYCTDRGSFLDFQEWIASAENLELLSQEKIVEDGKDCFVHTIRKTA